MVKMQRSSSPVLPLSVKDLQWVPQYKRLSNVLNGCFCFKLYFSNILVLQKWLSVPFFVWTCIFLSVCLLTLEKDQTTWFKHWLIQLVSLYLPSWTQSPSRCKIVSQNDQPRSKIYCELCSQHYQWVRHICSFIY